MSKAIVAYIPAIHKGYLNFFKKFPDAALFILGKDFLGEMPRIERDIRALAPEEIKTLIVALGIFPRVEVLDAKNLPDLQAMGEIIMPDEDVSHAFAETHLVGKTVNFVSTFLRWDKQISTKELEVPPDRIISSDAFDKEVMAAVFEEAEKSPDWWRQVAGVIIRDAEPILAKYNQPLPTDTFNITGDPRSNFDAGQNIELAKTLHAEVGLVAEAARQGISLEGTSMYITTFPCPVCARAIGASGIKKVFYRKGYSLLDAEDILKSFGVEIVLVK